MQPLSSPDAIPHRLVCSVCPLWLPHTEVLMTYHTLQQCIPTLVLNLDVQDLHALPVDLPSPQSPVDRSAVLPELRRF